MAMWVIMTSSWQKPGNCKGQYRNVALVQLTAEYTAKNIRPKMISERAHGVLRVVHMGHHNVGKTDKCAYAVTMKEAIRRVYALNNTPCMEANDALLASWGGSA